MTETLRAVFLSYASEDAVAALRICESLRAAGIEVWFDQSELRGGDAWDRQIRRQIHDCALFIAVVSAHTDARTEGYFRREWRLAVERTHDMADDAAFLLPVVIDDTPDSTARVPDQFHEVQWTRLPAGSTPPAFVDRVSRLLSADQGTVPYVPPPPSSQTPASGPTGFSKPAASPKVPWSSVPVLVLSAAVLIAAGWYLLGHFTSAKSTASAPRAAAPVSEKSIAVLPFVDMSEKHDQEYFSDGLSEELIDQLANVPELHVPARTSSFHFKGQNATIAEIAQALNVAHVLEGSVRKSGNTLRVSAQLIRVADGYHLWSNQYDRELKDVFRVQDDIASEVVQALRIKLVGAPPRAKARTESVAAHNLLLQGRFFEERYGPGDSDRAISYFEAALKEDPNYALAWAELSWAYQWEPMASRVERAKPAALKAIELDPSLAQAHAVLGWNESMYAGNWAAASSEFDQALALEPQNLRALWGEGQLARTLRRPEESLRYYEAALVRDPVAAWVVQGMSTTLLVTGRTAEAVRYARRALEISPDILGGHYYVGYALLANGESETALREFRLDPIKNTRLSGVARAELALHHRAAADAALGELIAINDIQDAVDIAQNYAARGDAKAAVAWLERAHAARVQAIGDNLSDPVFNAIRSDPGFKAFLRKLNLPE